MTTTAAVELRRFRSSAPSAVTIGTFDGVHRGHQYVIERLIRRAKELRLRSVVVTFHPNPRAVLRPESAPGELSSLPERVSLLESLGVDLVVPLTFDAGLAQLRAAEFTDLLTGDLAMRHLLIGPDFALGNRREGTPERLTEIGGESGFTVELLDALTDGSLDRVSSSAVRRALGAGDVAAAEAMLGRPYSVTGRVARGFRRGREIGFPTANVAVLPPCVIPADGVYVTTAIVGGESHAAATNIGNNPTFDNPDRSVEAYILDFDRDIYDQDLRLLFLQRLRGEERFDSVDALTAQIERDVAETRAVFSARPIG